jgi:mannose/fructose/N-acetylgalactosamine-specific phosphotransferase system component IIB
MEYRGKGLSHLINEARIKYAEQSKCDEAYCFVLKNNPRAIRLALQDGFSVRTIRQRPSNKPERNNAYYAKIDLQRKRNEFSKEDVEDAVFIQTGKNTILPKVLVSIEDQKLCDELLEKGYEIRWLIMAEDKIKNISQPTFYLEKI